MMILLVGLLSALVIGGIGATIVPTLAAWQWSRRIPASGAAEPVSLLKPLYGAEPRLAGNLATFLDQDWDAPIEMVCGVQRADDPARTVIADLRSAGFAPVSTSLDARRPSERGDGRNVKDVLDATPHGANAKIANLINMMPAVSHDLLILSDSDMAAPPGYLAAIAGTLALPGVGAVTCLYRGRGDAGPWSAFTAAASSYHFLPSVLLGLTLGIAKPCMGSTIALRRTTLARIGGFERFADRLADDFEIGAAVRALGLGVAIPPLLMDHASTETSFAAVWWHELRWAVTLRTIDPWGNAGTAFTYPLPFALLLLPLMPRLGLVLLLLALGSRYLLKRVVDRWAGAATCPWWMLPLRDCVSLAVFLSAFVARSVEWRGASLIMDKGRIMARRSD